MVTAPTKVLISLDNGQGTAEFWTTEFQKDDAALAPRLRAYWSWTSTGDWTLPRYPRLAFAGHSALYKCYILHPVTTASRPVTTPTRPSFVDSCLRSGRRLHEG